MDDLEMTRLCAEAMGFREDGCIPEYRGGPPVLRVVPDEARGYAVPYDPLHDDAQCFALVKRFNLSIDFDEDGPRWLASKPHPRIRQRWIGYATPDDLNRAVVECVAKMQAAK